MRSYKRAVKTPRALASATTAGYTNENVAARSYGGTSAAPKKPAPKPGKMGMKRGSFHMAQGGSGSKPGGLTRTNMGRQRL